MTKSQIHLFPFHHAIGVTMKNLIPALAIIGALCFISTADAQRLQAATNQNGNQNMPSVGQLAQMMITNFDADSSGELSQTELQSSLAALRQMMRQRAGGQNQAGQQQNGFANQQNALQGRQNLQADQGQGNRPPPPPGQAGFRPGR